MDSDKKGTRQEGQARGLRALYSRWRARRKALRLYLAVAAGTVLGGTARWLVGEVFHDLVADAFPWGTLFVNVTGSFFIGFYAALTASAGRLLDGAVQRHFVMTGLCGGYTTFSMFSLETVVLLQSGREAQAALYIGVSLVTWLLAVWTGYALGARWSRVAR